MVIIPHNSPLQTIQNQPLDQIHQIARWFEKVTPDPSPRNALTQLGLHFEEIAEMVLTIRNAAGTELAMKQLAFLVDAIRYFEERLMMNELEIDTAKLNRELLLDSLCDQIVTAVGVAHMFGLDIERGLKELADRNDSRFERRGKPIFSEYCKVMKGLNDKSPDLASHTTKGNHDVCETE